VCSGHPITLTASEPQPDRVLARLPESLDETRHPQPNDIYLLIEISTLEHNLNANKHLYAQAKISDYWMIDLQNRRVMAFRAPERTNYTQESKLTPGVISALALPKIDVEVKRLLA
jgi:Uma2 family endonuclease